MRFTTTVELGGKTATGFQVPNDVVVALGKGKKPPVTVTINGHTYRSTVAASCEIRFLAPTRLGDVLVASAAERSRSGRDGVYEVTVRSGHTVVAELTGHSREIRGVLFEEG